VQHFFGETSIFKSNTKRVVGKSALTAFALLLEIFNLDSEKSERCSGTEWRQERRKQFNLFLENAIKK
jgi:hypothetical protein